MPSFFLASKKSSIPSNQTPPTSVSTSATNWGTYKGQGFSLQLPPQWVSATSQTIVLFRPQENQSTNPTVQIRTIAASDSAAFLQLQKGILSGPNIQKGQMTIDGKTIDIYTTKAAKNTAPNSVQRITLFVPSADNTYMITTSYLANSKIEDIEALMKKILSSFTTR